VANTAIVIQAQGLLNQIPTEVDAASVKVGQAGRITLDAIKGKIKPVGDFDYASPFSETVLLGNVAVMVPNTRLLYDGANMRITNSEEATKRVHHQYREGWSLGTTRYTESAKK